MRIRVVFHENAYGGGTQRHEMKWFDRIYFTGTRMLGAWSRRDGSEVIDTLAELVQSKSQKEPVVFMVVVDGNPVFLKMFAMEIGDPESTCQQDHDSIQAAS